MHHDEAGDHKEEVDSGVPGQGMGLREGEPGLPGLVQRVVLSVRQHDHERRRRPQDLYRADLLHGSHRAR